MDPISLLIAEHETVADPSAATGGAPAGDGPSGTDPAAAGTETAAAAGAGTGEPDLSSTGATVPVPAASPAGLDPNDPAVADLLDQLLEQRLGPLAQLVQQSIGDPADPNAGQQAGFGDLELDPFDDGFGQNLATMLQQRDEQMLARIEQMFGTVAQPIQQQREEQQTAEGNQRVQDMIADDIARNGDFPRAPGAQESRAQKLVQPIAEMIFPQIASRFGNTPRAAEQAISRASQMIREVIAEAGAAAVEAHRNHTATLAGAGAGEPGPGAGGTGVITSAPVTDPRQIAVSLASKYGARAVAAGGTPT